MPLCSGLKRLQDVMSLILSLNVDKWAAHQPQLHKNSEWMDGVAAKRMICTSLEQAQSFLDLHLHPRMKSGLPPGCRCKPGKTATHPAFYILVGFGNGRILPLMFINYPNKFPEILIFNRLFLNTQPAHPWCGTFMKSSSSTGYFSNSTGSFVTGNFSTPSLNRWFLWTPSR